MGPGVIGFYPILRPGAPPFLYESQTNVHYAATASTTPSIPDALREHGAANWFRGDNLSAASGWLHAPARLCGIMSGTFTFRYGLANRGF